jgi:hypothetical protein
MSEHVLCSMGFIDIRKKHKRVFWVRGEKGCNTHPNFGRLDMRENRKDVKVSGQREVKQRRLTMHDA